MSTPVFILMAVSMPFGIILGLVAINRYGERFQAPIQARIHWLYILFGLGQIPAIYKGLQSRTWGLDFWLAVIIMFLAAAMVILHFQERKKQERLDQEPLGNG